MASSEVEESLLAAYERTYARGNRPFSPRQTIKASRHLLRYLPGSGASILDLGCGDGRLLYSLKSFGYKRLVGVDACPGLLTAAREKLGDGIELVKADIICYLARQEERFDVIFLFDIVEHFPLDGAVLAGTNPLVVDAVAARFMGFLRQAIPQIARGFEFSELAIFRGKPEDIEIVDEACEPLVSWSSGLKPFRSTTGWRARLEKP